MPAREQFNQLLSRMRLPVVAAPMFLVSGPGLVRAARRSGIMASFPFPNARSIEQLEAWLKEACRDSDEDGHKLAPLAANMLTHSSYDRAQAEIALVAQYKPDIVITALGGPKPVISGAAAASAALSRLASFSTRDVGAATLPATPLPPPPSAVRVPNPLSVLPEGGGDSLSDEEEQLRAARNKRKVRTEFGGAHAQQE